MISGASIVEVQPLLLAAVRRQATAETLAQTVISAPVWSLLAARGLSDTGRTVVIYWNDEDHSLQAPDGVPIDVGVEVNTPFHDDPTLTIVKTPSGRTASLRHVGAYQALPLAHVAIRNWCAIQGVDIAGPSWEVFEHFDLDPAKCETDIFYLLS